MAHDTLRVLVTREEDALVAQCLEHDISVQAVDMVTLQRRFEDAVAAEGGDVGIAHLPPAPDEFHALWDAAGEIDGAPDNTEMRLAA